jgi:hypothetical protein
MAKIRTILVCACLAAGAFALTCAGLCLLSLSRSAHDISASVGTAAAAIPATLLKETAATRVALVGDPGPNPLTQRILDLANSQLSGLRKDAASQLDALREVADRRVGDSLARVDVALADVGRLREDLAPAIGGAVAIEAHVDRAVVDLHPQLLGLVAASKVAAGQAATTLRDIQTATPQFIATVQDTAAHADAATEAGVAASKATQQTMENLSTASKPLPLPVRLFFQIAPGAAGIVGGVLESMAATGAIR